MPKTRISIRLKMKISREFSLTVLPEKKMLKSKKKLPSIGRPKRGLVYSKETTFSSAIFFTINISLSANTKKLTAKLFDTKSYLKKGYNCSINSNRLMMFCINASLLCNKE